MSLKGALPKANEKLQDEPFVTNQEESKGPAKTTTIETTATKTNQAAAGNEETKTTENTASKEPILGLESNNNQNQNKVPLKTIDQLLIHNSDTAVKPIIGNKDIERHGNLEFTASSLPFEAWTAE